jgi:hypothetical protein
LKLFHKIDSGEMPSKDAICSSLTEINPVTNWLKKTFVDADRWTAMAELSCEDFMDQHSRVTAQTPIHRMHLPPTILLERRYRGNPCLQSIVSGREKQISRAVSWKQVRHHQLMRRGFGRIQRFMR